MSRLIPNTSCMLKRPRQTAQTHIRLLLLISVFPVCFLRKSTFYFRTKEKSFGNFRTFIVVGKKLYTQGAYLVECGTWPFMGRNRNYQDDLVKKKVSGTFIIQTQLFFVAVLGSATLMTFGMHCPSSKLNIKTHFFANKCHKRK